jgi:acyl-CoA thioester hydrolase
VHETRLQTRWTDFDLLGHVTHAAYPVFLDEARDAFLRERVGSFDEFPYVLVHVSIDYRREIRRPAPELVVRTRIAEVGRTSVTFEQEVLEPDAEPAANARAVVAAWDADVRAARPLTDDERTKLG